ncbi:hypothetical protein EXN66_Car013301 [Channa argus]|uniref:Uncharacterized protein n=1 Tax=Channa argus TaxID=215402 RepID=A0A6G1Q4S4_CHAAH|nr:hypothetical protein EXN66_Car013301 [Channa argus]KAK2900127.1 hypothetical protein Q8A73_013256 [Channa argus]
MAAAAALTRDRRVTSVRAKKGLFFVFTLVVVVCPANSLIDKDKLDELRLDLQKLKLTLEKRKVEHFLDSEFTSKIMDDALSLIDHLTRLTRETMPEFTPLLELMEDLKPFMESTKAYVQKEIERDAAEIHSYEEKMQTLERKITHLGKYDDL